MPTIKRQLTRDMPNRDRIVALLELRLAPEGKRFDEQGLSPGFAATGEIYEARPNASGATRQRQGRDWDSGGAVHDAILRAFPQAKPFVDLHLSDPDGTPMHAEANGWYWYAPSQGNMEDRYNGMTGEGPLKWRVEERGLPFDQQGKMRYCYLLACEMLRVAEIPANLGREEFTEFVNGQRDRWRQEAAAGRQWLESLTEEKTENE